jgi:hypothetical protein
MKPVIRYHRLVALGLLLSLNGCGDRAGGRLAVHGAVTLDGQSLGGGSISFRPVAGSTGPTAGAKVVDGRFAIPSDKSLFAGKYRVEITATRKTGKQVKDPTFGAMVDQVAQYLPGKYNRSSELTAEVKPGGPNDFTFNLRTSSQEGSADSPR